MIITVRECLQRVQDSVNMPAITKFMPSTVSWGQTLKYKSKEFQKNTFPVMSFVKLWNNNEYNKLLHTRTQLVNRDLTSAE